jgi:tripartite ATP-independent transporter DctM subunit
VSTARDKLKAALGLWQILVLIFVVLGGIYGGIASPTEVSALGSSLAILFAAISGQLTWGAVWKSGQAAVRQTSMILFVMFTAKILSVTLIYYQLPIAMVKWIKAAGVTTANVFLAVVIIYVILGCFFEGIAMMVITIPFIVPVMNALSMDLVWMGVVICILVEVGLLTPPVGLNLYVLRGVTGEPMVDVIRGSLPFVIFQLLMILILWYYPDLAVALPRLVMG